MSFLPDPLHPALVHFPIALSLVAVVLELLSHHPRLRSLSGAAGLLLGLAAAGAVAAVLSGQAARDEAVVPAGAAALLARHEDAGELAMWLLLAAVALRLLLAWRGWFVRWGAWLYLGFAAAAAATAGYNGYMGGRMVFDHGVGTAPVQRAVAPASPPAPPAP